MMILMHRKHVATKGGGSL